jgi:hypothetical protein
VYRIAPIVLATMLMIVLYVFNAGRGDSAMKTIALVVERPPIDLDKAEKLETATFALG